MPAKPPTVSIMLPARDAAATLDAAARSCLEQSWTDLELVLIENDSTPKTRAIMENLERADSRVRIVHSPPAAGFIAALNLGWRESRGNLLARMDADDICHPQRIARQVAMLESRPDLAACATLVRILRREFDGTISAPLQGYADFEAWLNSVRKPDDIAAQRFIDSPIANPSAMIRREFFEQLGGYRKTEWAEDYDFWLRLIEKDLKIAKCSEILLDWFDSSTRLTRNNIHYAQERFLAAKAHFLARMIKVRKNGVAICGAGPIGKRIARLLQREEIRIHAFLEVSPRRIGNQIAGIPVIGSQSLPLPNHPVMIGAVGLPGARDRIRDLLTSFDYVEGTNFFCVA